MMRKWHGFVLIVFALSAMLGGQAGVGAAVPIHVALNGSKLPFADAKPFRDTLGKVLVPLRFITESLKAKVDWDEQTHTVTVKSSGKEAVLVLGSRVATVNGTVAEMETAAVKQKGRVYVPVRFISEVLDRKVVWDDANATVHIWSLTSDDELEILAGSDTDHAHFSSQFTEVQDGKLYFKNEINERPAGAFRGYVVGEQLVPELNQKAYRMVRYLTDDQEYTEAKYDPDMEILTIHYASSNTASPYFTFAFFEKKKQQSFASKNVFGTLTVNGLMPTTPHIENRLRMGLVVLFGEATGIKIDNWVMELYLAMGKGDSVRNKNYSKRFGDIQADYMNAGDSQITVHFSYLN